MAVGHELGFSFDQLAYQNPQHRLRLRPLPQGQSELRREPDARLDFTKRCSA